MIGVLADIQRGDLNAVSDEIQSLAISAFRNEAERRDRHDTFEDLPSSKEEKILARRKNHKHTGCWA